MDKQDVLELYKEQYAHELSRKDTITAQIQVRFAAIATIATLLIYVTKNVELNLEIHLLSLLGLLLLLSIFMLTRISINLLNVYWDNKYDYIPFSDALEDTRKQMESKGVLSEQPDAFIDFLLEEFSGCAGQNGKLNDGRQANIQKTNKQLKQALVPVAIIGALFVGLDLDAASSRKNLTVEIMEGNQTEQKKRDNIPAIEMQSDENPILIQGAIQPAEEEMK